MDLYIRSQKKYNLIKINELGIENEEVDEYTIKNYNNNNTTILGRYKTEKRALEVLDEIQGILNVKENLQFNGVDINDVFKDMNPEETKQMLYQMSVYEMPKEEE